MIIYYGELAKMIVDNRSSADLKTAISYRRNAASSRTENLEPQGLDLTIFSLEGWSSSIHREFFPELKTQRFLAYRFFVHGAA